MKMSPRQAGGLIPASPSKGQHHEPPNGGAAQSTFNILSDVVGWLVDSNQYINVDVHEIVSKTTNATVSHGQTFRSPPPGVRPGGGFTCLIISNAKS